MCVPGLPWISMLFEECKSGLDGREMRHEIEKFMRMIRMRGGLGRAMGLWRKTARCRAGCSPGMCSTISESPSSRRTRSHRGQACCRTGSIEFAGVLNIALGNIESLSRHYADLSKTGMGGGVGCRKQGQLACPGKRVVCTHENVAKLERNLPME